MQIARILRFISVTILICFSFFSVQAQQTAQKFIQETHYLLSLPDGYDQDTAKRWPLLMFLHGSGERGYDLQLVKMHGPPKLVEQGRKFPFIVVSPQAQLPYRWEPESLYKLLQHLKQTQRVDHQRIYLTGLSMGGYGTWELAIKHPEEFAAIAPVCGGGDSSQAWKLRNVPVWCFHGAKDDVVLPAESERMVTAARRYNPAVQYTLYPEANHNSWDATYDNDSLYQWMLAQTKFSYKEAPVQAAPLKQYAGTYINASKDTVLMYIENGGLMVKPGREEHPLKPAGKDLFFIEPQLPFDLRFTRKKGKIDGFIFMGEERMEFRKL